jgi:hypothetical protein
MHVSGKTLQVARDRVIPAPNVFFAIHRGSCAGFFTLLRMMINELHGIAFLLKLPLGAVIRLR